MNVFLDCDSGNGRSRSGTGRVAAAAAIPSPGEQRPADVGGYQRGGDLDGSYHAQRTAVDGVPKTIMAWPAGSVRHVMTLNSNGTCSRTYYNSTGGVVTERHRHLDGHQRHRAPCTGLLRGP